MRFLSKILIAVSIASLGYCSYYLYRELTSRVERKGGEVIGSVVFKKRSASRKYTDSVIWEEIAQESEIYNYDAIRTMEYSSATLTLKDGTKIELDQNTMLVVIMKEQGVDINFDRGGVSAENTSGTNTAVTLNSKDASISLSKGDISINSDDSGMNIHLNSGSAKVAAGGKELSINPNEMAMLKDGKAESGKERLLPKYPGRNLNLLSYGKTAPVNFSWESDLPGEAKIEISMNSRFAPLYKTFSTKKSQYEYDIPPGDYYWRVVKGNTKSRAVKFSVLSDQRPEQIAPYKNQRLTLTEGTELVTFRWDRSRHAVNYEVTVARDSAFSDTVLKLTSRINTISASNLAPGTYHWKVKSIFPQRITSESSEMGPIPFTVERKEFTMTRPVPLDTGNVTTAGPFTLSWKGVSGASRYRLEVSSEQEFNEKLISKTQSATFARIKEKLKAGRYYWRVNASRGEKTSEWSETEVLDITEPVQIAAVYPSSGSVLYEKPDYINFSWSDPNRGNNYLVEISDRKEFKNITDSADTTASSVRIKNPGIGMHYWRVKLRDEAGRIIAQSRPSDFTLPADMKPPVLVSPKQNEKITPGVTKRLKLQWKKIEGVNEYEVEIFERIAGAERSLSVYTAKKPYLELSNQMLYKPGRFSWLVRAKKTKGGRVTAFRESGKSYFEIGEVTVLPAPVVKSSNVLFNAK